MTPQINPDEARKLLGGYATGTLTESERETLFAAALEDQSLFDALAEEDALRELLESPGAKTRLLAATAEKPAAFWFGIPGLTRTRAWSFGGLAAIIALTVAFLAQKPTLLPERPSPLSDEAAPPKPSAASSPTPTTKDSPVPTLAKRDTQPAIQSAKQSPALANPSGSGSARGPAGSARPDETLKDVSKKRETASEETARPTEKAKNSPAKANETKAADTKDKNVDRIDEKSAKGPDLEARKAPEAQKTEAGRTSATPRQEPAAPQPKPPASSSKEVAPAPPPPAPALAPKLAENKPAASNQAPVAGFRAAPAPPVEQQRRTPSQSQQATAPVVTSTQSVEVQTSQQASAARQQADSLPPIRSSAAGTQPQAPEPPADQRSRDAVESGKAKKRISAGAGGGFAGAVRGTPAPLTLRYRLDRQGADAPPSLTVEASSGFVYILRRSGRTWDTVARGNGPHTLTDSGEYSIVASRAELSNPASVLRGVPTNRNIVTDPGDGYTSLSTPESSLAATVQVRAR